MLLSTFQHIKGIGKTSESSLWEKGITTWDKYKKINGQQLSLFEKETISPIDESFEALNNNDLSFFAERLPKSLYYRIGLIYPEDTIFLDIETTGLSLYYDQITLVGWSLGRKYGVYLKDQSEKPLLDALKSAKIIVTFNGTIFDIKFLQKTFPNIYIPPVHIDLRFFAKRAGYSGGQKVIEDEIKFERPNDIKGMEGESAPILWYKYRRGDQSALKQLIEYNHSDVEGMKHILDRSLERIYEIDDIPQKIRIKPIYSKLSSTIDWAKCKPKKINPYKIYLPKFKGSLKPLISYDQLSQNINLKEVTFIGIDLVSSEERESGYCILKGNKSETYRIKTDDDMIRIAKDCSATLISIDSPLSIPKGRTTYFDDDPNREKYGIMRECERILKKRGVNVYPCLIPSMQKLTRRGMRLADKFRKIGIPVIESYPGAAQDILAIPRKRAGLQYLASALVDFGIYDNFTDKNISHDELDAITSAIVGTFFWVGMFEGIGNDDEEYLIIPDLNADTKLWLSRKVVGISGNIGSGKSIASEYLKKKGFILRRFSEILEQILKDRKQTINRTNLQKLGCEMHLDPGQRWLGKKLLEELPADKSIVIDGMRYPDDYALMVETFGPSFIHLFIDAPLEIRKERALSRKRENISIEKIFNDPAESGIEDLKKLSSNIIINDGSKNSYFKKIEAVLSV